jgi:hypothetical protein
MGHDLSVQHITHDCKLGRVLRCCVGVGIAIALSRDVRRPVGVRVAEVSDLYMLAQSSYEGLDEGLITLVGCCLVDGTLLRSGGCGNEV